MFKSIFFINLNIVFSWDGPAMIWTNQSLHSTEQTPTNRHLDAVLAEDGPDAQGHGQNGPTVKVGGAVDGRQVGLPVGADLKENNQIV